MNKQDFEFSITVPKTWFTLGHVDLSRVKIKNKELKISYLLFFNKKINTNEIDNIELTKNILTDTESSVKITTKNKTITFQFYGVDNAQKLKEAIMTSKNLEK